MKIPLGETQMTYDIDRLVEIQSRISAEDLAFLESIAAMREAEAWDKALEEAAALAETRHEHWRLPHKDDAKPGEVCDDISACKDIATAIRDLCETRTKAGGA